MTDLISRQEVIKHLKKRLYETALNNYPDYSYYEEIADNRVDTWLNELPSAQPESEERKAESAQNVPIEYLISRKAAIDTEGLEEEIRCEMCRNQMKTNRGCDGNCKYDEKLYEKIMQILDERIKPLPSAQPEIEERTEESAQNVPKEDLISRKAAIDALGKEGLITAMVIVDRVPSVHPEIIYCNDCKHSGEKPISDGRFWCNIHNAYMYYCSGAERIE